VEDCIKRRYCRQLMSNNKMHINTTTTREKVIQKRVMEDVVTKEELQKILAMLLWVLKQLPHSSKTQKHMKTLIGKMAHKIGNRSVQGKLDL
jgi:heme oxygenase